MAKEKKITQPTIDDERELIATELDKPVKVRIGKREYKICRLRNWVIRKITDIVLNEEDDRKVTAKSVAAILLGRYWKIKLFYWIVWRWIYYVVEWDEVDMREAVETAKKKVAVEAYLLNTMCLTEMKETTMMMTRAEVNRFRQEQVGGQPTP